MTSDDDRDRGAPPLAVWALAVAIVGIAAIAAALLLGTGGALALLTGM